MIDIEVVECDFENPYHKEKLVYLMNQYIKDEMGGGEIIKGRKEKELIEGLRSTPGGIVLFGYYDKKIVGLIIGFIRFATFAVKKMINIHDIIVEKQYRNNGIGKTLLSNIIQMAKKMNCSKVTLEVRYDNIKAQYLYKSLEFGECNPPMHFWVKKIS